MKVFLFFLVSLKFEASHYRKKTASTRSAELIHFEATHKVKIFHFGFNLVSSSDDRKSTAGFQSPSGLNLPSSSPSLSSKGLDFLFLKGTISDKSALLGHSSAETVKETLTRMTMEHRSRLFYGPNSKFHPSALPTSSCPSYEGHVFSSHCARGGVHSEHHKLFQL